MGEPRADEPRILVVDDEKPVRRLMAAIVARGGFKTLEAQSGAEALEMAEHEHVDLVVTDVQMPGMTGPELVRALRGRGLVERSLLVSGYAGEAEMAGIPLVLKPFTAEQFLGRIQEALAC